MSQHSVGVAGAGFCAECRQPLTSMRHGWVTVQVTWKVQARVHTLCRSKFTARPLPEQKERAAA